MWGYLQSIWDCRHFWLSLVLNDLHLRYRRSVLGIGWSLLFPLATTLVTGTVFHEIFKVPIREFLPFIFSGFACWAYLTGVILQGCQSYIAAEPYIRQHPLPLAVYPLRTTLGTLVHFLIALALVFGLTQLFKGPHLPVALLWLPPALVLLFMFGWAIGILAGFVNTVFRDTQHILEVGFQILFYLTPIIYPASMLAQTRVGWLLAYNPLAPFLDLIRRPMLEGRPPSKMCLISAAAVVLVTVFAAVASLRHQQRRVVFYL